MESIELIHGEGGKHTYDLIRNIFYKSFGNNVLLQGLDSAILELNRGKIAFTTDSFVVSPLFFKGGDIGRLAICGTVNDLTVCGAVPLYLSVGFIIEEGFQTKMLEKIALSMGRTCEEAGAKIVTGDTKVVERGKVDGIFINTAGIGIINGYTSKKIEEGDKIIITGTIAEHGTAIGVERYDLKVQGDIKSDCTPLNHLLDYLDKYKDNIKLMRDPTRGGIGEALNEISEGCRLGIHLFEEKIPIRNEVKAINEMLGLDPLYLASEGRMLIVADRYAAEKIERGLKEACNCREASIIGIFTDKRSFVYIENSFGGKRVLGSLETQMLPRIC